MKKRLLLIALLTCIASACSLCGGAAAFAVAMFALPQWEEGINYIASLFIAAPIGFLLGLLASIPLMLRAMKGRSPPRLTSIPRSTLI